MNRLLRTLFLVAALLFLAGCAATPPTAEHKLVVAEPPAPTAGEKPVTPPRLTEDRDLFAEGVALLNQPDRSGKAKARAVFASLLEHYPQSRWRSASETFIHLLDEIAASQEKDRRDRLQAEQIQAEQLQAERAEAKQENEALEKRLRELTEKYQKETAALVQENEKLKRDLQRLKALEIELEKRERMLR
jgi:chromosome segregation ATPase